MTRTRTPFVSGSIRIANGVVDVPAPRDESTTPSPEYLALPDSETTVFLARLGNDVHLATVTGQSSIDVVVEALRAYHATERMSTVYVRRLHRVRDRSNRIGSVPHVLHHDSERKYVSCRICMTMVTETSGGLGMNDFATDCPGRDLETSLKILVGQKILDFVDGVWIRKFGPVRPIGFGRLARAQANIPVAKKP